MMQNYKIKSKKLVDYRNSINFAGGKEKTISKNKQIR